MLGGLEESLSVCSTPEHDSDNDENERLYATPTRHEKAEIKMRNHLSVSSVKSIPRWAALEELERDRNRVSTNKERVRAITQKLSKLQQGIEADKSRARYNYDNRLKQIENSVLFAALFSPLVYFFHFCPVTQILPSKSLTL